MKNRLRPSLEERNGLDTVINPSRGQSSGTSANKAGIAVGQIRCEEMHLSFITTKHHNGRAKTRLGRTMAMGRRHIQRPASTTILRNVILDRRIAAVEAVLIPKPPKNPLDGMSLLAVPAAIAGYHHG